MKFFKNKRNVILTVLCLLIIIFCIYAIQNESFFKSRRITAEESIGTLEQPQKDVRLKDDVSYSWLKAEPAELLANGDSIFTGDDSSALVVLKNGQQIYLAPNSLIKLNFRNQKIEIDIPYGDVKFEKVVSDVSISDCGQTYDLAPGEESVDLGKTKKCGSTKVKTKSVATIRNIQKSLAKVEIPELPPELVQSEAPVEPVVQNDPQAPPEIQTPTEQPVVEAPLLAPQPENLKLSYDIVKKTPVNIKWPAIASAKEYIVEMASDREFTQPTVTHVPNNEYAVNEIERTQFFRIKAVADQAPEGAFSEVGEINIKYPRIKMKEPKLFKEYRARNAQDLGQKEQFQVSWSEVPNTDKYIVEVKNAVNQVKVDRKETRTPASQIEVPQTGKYTYTVTALDSTGRKISSSGLGEVLYERVFKVISPLIKEGLNEKFFYFQKTGAKYIGLAWSMDGGESTQTNDYRVELAKDPQFAKVIKSVKTKRLNLIWPYQIDAGQYYWRVRSEQGEQYSDWSNTESFKVSIGK